MSDEKGFRKMSELVAALNAAEAGLRSGELGLDGLDTACTDARELYERLVVLRHKAREVATQTTKPPVVAEPTVAAPTAEPMRLDTRPQESPQRQTSLIEEIEATEQQATQEPPAPKPAPAPKPVKSPSASPRKSSHSAPASLAERMEKASITDLSKAISLSHKFWFVAELFNGDRAGYEKAIEQLNSAADHDSAKSWFESEVMDKLKKPADPEALATFTELLQRRFA